MTKIGDNEFEEKTTPYVRLGWDKELVDLHYEASGKMHYNSNPPMSKLERLNEFLESNEALGILKAASIGVGIYLAVVCPIILITGLLTAVKRFFLNS